MINTWGMLFHVPRYYTAMKRKAVCSSTEQTDGCQGLKLCQVGWTHKERGRHCRILEVTSIDKFTHGRRNGGQQRAKGTQPGVPRWAAAVTRGAGLGMSLRSEARGL